MKKPHVLVIEDDPYIGELLSLYLEKEQYRYTIKEDGQSGLSVIESDPPDLLILDIMLPKIDGWQVLEEVRQISQIPVIMLTGKGEPYDKLKGFHLGADDYVVKPFEPKELMARMKAVLRRSHPTLYKQSIQLPGLAIDADEYTVKVLEAEVSFPPKEVELLYYLAYHPNKVYTREQLLAKIWGAHYDGDTRTVDVHIKRIREKIGETDHWRLVTVWGVGYRFEVSN